jgi:hypothetical protein
MELYVEGARNWIEATRSVPRAVASGGWRRLRSLPLAVLTRSMPCEFQILAPRACRQDLQDCPGFCLLRSILSNPVNPV